MPCADFNASSHSFQRDRARVSTLFAPSIAVGSIPVVHCWMRGMLRLRLVFFLPSSSSPASSLLSPRLLARLLHNMRRRLNKRRTRRRRSLAISSDAALAKKNDGMLAQYAVPTSPRPTQWPAQDEPAFSICSFPKLCPGEIENKLGRLDMGTIRERTDYPLLGCSYLRGSFRLRQLRVA